jgi:hypothetical protein
MGTWASCPDPIVEIHSTKARKATLEFSVGSFVESATMTVVLNDRPVKKIEVAVKEGNRITPTRVRWRSISNRDQYASIRRSKEMFIPEELGQWKDRRALRLGFSQMTLNGIAIL